MSSAGARNPYVGLRPFDTPDAPLFFGRDRHIEELLGRLRSQRFLGVVGTSGSGKSSLVRAGLIPTLNESFLSESGGQWSTAIFRPGEDPIDSLTAALAKSDSLGLPQTLADTLTESTHGLVEAVLRSGLRSSQNLLLVVDQFEEIFRYPTEKKERAALFVDLLLKAAASDRCSIFVILTMRSDYLGECARYPGLAERLNGGQYLIPRLTRDERQEAIEGPALIGGVRVDAALVARLLNDSGNEPDQLPILQHTLSRIFEVWSTGSREGPLAVAHLEDERIGGMRNALDNHAKAVLGSLAGIENQRIARLLFRRITSRSSGQRDTRRPTKVSEIMSVTGASLASVQQIYGHFSTEGINFLHGSPEGALTKDSILDIAHESLISNWSTLRNWVDYETDLSRTYLRLAEAARVNEGFTLGAASVYLLWHRSLVRELVPIDTRSSASESAVLRLRTGFNPRFPPLLAWAGRYKVDGEDVSELVFQHLQKGYASKVLWVSLVYGVIALLVAGGLYTFQQQRLSALDKLQKDAQAEVVDANEKLFNQAPRDALVAAVKGVTLAQPEVKGAFEVLRRATLATPSGTLLVKDQLVSSVAWSSDGKRLAAVGGDGKLLIWDVPLSTDKRLELGGKARVLAAAWKPGGGVLATSDSSGRVELWTLDGRPPSLLMSLGTPPVTLAWHSDGMLAAADYKGAIKIWRDGKVQELRDSPSPILSLAWNPVSHMLAAGYRFSQITFFDGDTGKRRGDISDVLVKGQRAPIMSIQSLAWAPDGKRIVSGAADWNARVWNVATGLQVGTHVDHRGIVNSIKWRPSSVDQFATASGAGVKVVQILADGGYRTTGELGLNTQSVFSLDFAPGGKRLAVALYGKVDIYDLDVLDATTTEDWLKAARGRLGK